MVPAVRGPEIVKSGCPEKSNFMMVPAVRGPQIVKLESWKIKKTLKFTFLKFPRFQLYDFTPQCPE